MPVDVSVVVPVYNPGRAIDPCIDSLLSQTIDPARAEYIFVDDGSTDDAPALLDRLADAHPNVVAVHQPNCGNPGGPRNTGMDLAEGGYLFFCDHDDWLEPEALERLVAVARETAADIVIPKMVTHGRGVPWRLFRGNVHAETIPPERAMDALSPHKLFRLDFLRDNAIRFPTYRLEDLIFVATAYLQQPRIVVSADYPYYHHTLQADGEHISRRPVAAADYYWYVDRVLDVFDKHTAPGEFRDSAMLRIYRNEMLSRVEARQLIQKTPERSAEMLAEIRARALDRFPPDYHQRLALAHRTAARAMLAGRLDDLKRLAEASIASTARVVVDELASSGPGYRLALSVELANDGTPIEVRRDGDGWRMDERVLPADLDPQPHPQAEVTAYEVDVLLRHRGRRVEWFVPSDATTRLMPTGRHPETFRVVVSATATIDPQTLAAGAPLDPGDWDLLVRLDALGFERSVDRGFAVSDHFSVPAPSGRTTPRYNATNGRLVFAVRR